MMANCVEHLKYYRVVILDKLEEWSDRSFLKFSTGKCFLLHLEHDSPMEQHRLGADGSDLLQGCPITGTDTAFVVTIIALRKM